MIRCLSCCKSSDVLNLYKVKLISDTILDEMPTSGKDVVGIANSIIFDQDSELIINTNQNIQKYIYKNKEFILDEESTNNDIKDNNPFRFIIDDDGVVIIN